MVVLLPSRRRFATPLVPALRKVARPAAIAGNCAAKCIRVSAASALADPTPMSASSGGTTRGKHRLAMPEDRLVAEAVLYCRPIELNDRRCLSTF
jgi:hypothetical protein